MATVNYTDLGLKKQPGLIIFKWNGKDIEVIKNLSVSDKYDIVMITLQKSYEDGIYNPIKLDMYFHLNLIYLYTNIIFSEEDRKDEERLYDELKQSGFLDKFLSIINETEYTEMLTTIENLSNLRTTYDSTTASMVKNFINDLPENAKAMQDIVNNFDSEKYQAVVDFAKAANGGREIK